MTAIEIIATIRANRKPTDAPSEFSPMKIAYRMIHSIQAGTTAPVKSVMIWPAYAAENNTMTAVVTTYSMDSEMPVMNPPHGPRAARANE